MALQGLFPIAGSALQSPWGLLAALSLDLCAPPILQLLAKLPGPVAPRSTAQLESVILGRLFRDCEGQQSKP